MDMKDIKNLDKEQILEMLGLQQADTTLTSTLRALGFLGIGALVGAVAMLFLAPQTGREMRENVVKKVRNTTDQAVSAVRNKVDEASQTARG
jgi:gas vesicle protein